MTQIGYDAHGRLRAVNDAGEILAIDDPAETEHYSDFVARARGRVLLLGLGLGIMARQLIEKPDVVEIVGVDIDRAMCAYVASAIAYPSKLSIVNSDCWEWKPLRAFDYGYYSIWHQRDLTTLVDAERLKERFAPYVLEQHVDQEEVLLAWEKEQPCHR